jgi:acetyl-CoA carboxylase beta subunit
MRNNIILNKGGNMKCKKCGEIMFINYFGGYKWECCNCEHIGREATNKEIEDDEKLIEKEFAEMAKETLKSRP